MNLPIPRHRREEPTGDGEHERLHASLQHDLDRWPDFATELLDSVRDVAPLADLEEADDCYLVDVELPGVRREDIDLQVHQGRLVVSAERRERERVGLLRHRTRTTGRLRLEVALPVEVDPQGVTASLDHGVLAVRLPKVERARRRRIAVRAS
jgi:HSP20 family protein